MKKILATIIMISISLTRLFSQRDVIQQLQEEFITKQQKRLAEKIYIHTDRSFYVTGELLWFKLYNVDGLLHKPFPLSKQAYVELLTADNKPVAQCRVALTDASGHGSFLLPASLSSGTYRIRGYTSLMKNYSPEYFFYKPIQVVNTQKRPDWIKLDHLPLYDLQFFPEGGNLVAGLQSKLAFKATDQYGKGFNCIGWVLNQQNDTVARFSSHRFGMGAFLFRPVPGHNYHAIVKVDGDKIISKPLPPVHASGFIMTVETSNTTDISVTVSGTQTVHEGRPVYLFAHTRGSLKLLMTAKISYGNAVFVFNAAQLGQGISHFTVFDENKNPVCERLYFKMPAVEMHLQLKPDKAMYTARDKVTLDIDMNGNKDYAARADLSIAVFLLDSLEKADENNIYSYLWLSSDLNGYIESPGYYFSHSTPDAIQALDHLLLTQGWRRFNWQETKTDNNAVLKFLPEYEGHIITGILTSKSTGLPVSGVRAFLSVPGKDFSFSSAKSDALGMLNFPVSDLYGTDEVIVQVEDSAYHVNLLSPFAEAQTFQTLPKFSIQQKFEKDLLAHTLSAQVGYAYNRDKLETFAIPSSDDSSAFYGNADKTYYLDDYTRFTTMEEVMREYVPEVRVRKINDQFQYQVKNTAQKTFFDVDPLVLVDGVPVTINKAIALDPLKIRKLEVVTKPYFFNGLENQGIVSYTSYDEDFSAFELPPNSVIMDYKGLQMQRVFYAPVYANDESRSRRLPDFRTLLHWSPDVKPGKDGKHQLVFYTSDLPGTYAVMAQGVDADGTAGYKTITFTVK